MLAVPGKFVPKKAAMKLLKPMFFSLSFLSLLFGETVFHLRLILGAHRAFGQSNLPRLGINGPLICQLDVEWLMWVGVHRARISTGVESGTQYFWGPICQLAFE